MLHRSLLSLACLLGFVSTTQAQLIEAPLSQRINSAQIIVEGVVVESTPFYNAERTMIHTVHRLSVYKVFKNDGRTTALQEIELITPGGQIDDEWHVVQPALELQPGMKGIFFVDRRPGHAGRPDAHVPYAGKQGFVEYDGRRPGLARDVFAGYDDIATELYKPIQERVGRPSVVLDLFDPGQAKSRRAITSHSISGFTPGTVHAGVQDLLTINGTGFGTLTGSAAILFDEADDGLDGAFGPADDAHIQSWSDTQIQVWVPNRLTAPGQTNGPAAGSGLIGVRNAAGEEVFSSGTLTVGYGLNEILWTDPAVELFRIRPVNTNQIGGYTFRFSTNRANNGVDFTSVPAAMSRLQDALTLWNCQTGWNAVASGTTTVADVGNDGVNFIAFDNDAEPLSAFALGETRSFFVRFFEDAWHIAGTDIRFKREGQNGTTWYYGTDAAGIAGSESDFMSTALHELGHAVQHSHVNDENDAMYFQRTTGTTRRSLSAANIAGGIDVVALSSSLPNDGSTTQMIAFDCTVPPTANFVAVPNGTCGTNLTVDFDDLSMNGPTSWSWTFGDTGTSNARNPSHAYASPGFYSVSLEATNNNGTTILDRPRYVAITNAPAEPVPATCDPGFVDHNPCCSIGIRNVSLNAINVSTDTHTEGDPLLEDFTCSSFTVLDAGVTYPISIAVGPNNAERVEVYVDWDGDGDLEPGELAFSSGPAMNHAGNITVPGTAVAGTALRMRVLSDLGSIGDACTNIEFGQVEDYSVLVSAPAVSPGGVPQTSLTVDKGSTDGDVNLAWGASCSTAATDYTVHEGTIGSYYSHASRVCTTAGATSLNDLTPVAGDRYFIVVPVSASDEGSYGQSSTPVERPVSTAVCLATQDLTACP